MVNIVICAHNRLDSLCDILSMLCEQTVLPEVTVVDDSDEPVMNLTNLKYPVLARYIWNKPDGLYHRVGKYNLGLSLAQGKTILLDDDCIPIGTRFVEEYESQLHDYHIVRGAFLHEGKVKEIPWFSTANVGMRVPHLFDPYYDGMYGYEDLDFGQYVEKISLSVGRGHTDTAVEHIGISYQGDRDSAERNQRYYKQKWGL